MDEKKPLKWWDGIFFDGDATLVDSSCADATSYVWSVTASNNSTTDTTWSTNEYGTTATIGTPYTYTVSTPWTWYPQVVPYTVSDGEGNEVKLEAGKITIRLKDGRVVSIPDDIDKLNEKIDKLEKVVKMLQEAMEGGIDDEQSVDDKVPE